MKCIRCQNQLRKGASFCPVCGTRVERRKGLGAVTILLAAVILLSVTGIGAAAGILLTENQDGNQPVIALFSQEAADKEADAIDHPAEEETETADAACIEVEADNGSTAPSATEDASSRPGKLSDEQLQKISALLGVPEDLDTRIVQGEPTYWEGGAMYRTPVQIYHDEEFIAGASVESFTGGIAGNVYTYSQPEEPTSSRAEEGRSVRGFVSNAENGLNVRESPSTSSKSVRRIYNGESVVITEQLVAEGLYWGRISGGWICTNYVTFEQEGAALDDRSQETGAEPYMVSPSADVLNIRSGPGTSYQSIGRIPGGEALMIYNETTAEGRTWGRTDIGWVCMDYLIPADFETDMGYDDGYSDFSQLEEENGSLDDFFV